MVWFVMMCLICELFPSFLHSCFHFFLLFCCSCCHSLSPVALVAAVFVHVVMLIVVVMYWFDVVSMFVEVNEMMT